MAESCVFFGTPEFALPALRSLLESAYEVRAVVTRPDKPSGRGRRVGASPVKQSAMDAGVTVLQPASLRSSEAVGSLTELAADFYVVAAYGLLVPPDVLALPARGVLNIHPSLLPRHRGASPVAGAILAGDTTTGVTIMLMDEGLDTGPVLTQREVEVGPNESTGELTKRLSEVAADLLVDTIPTWLASELEPQPQEEQSATYSPQLTREDGRIDWSRNADDIWRRVRAMNSWPGAETSLNRARLHIWRAWPLQHSPTSVEVDSNRPSPGTIVELTGVDTPAGRQDSLTVVCGVGALAVLELQKEGRRALSAAEFAQGERSLVGTTLGA